MGQTRPPVAPEPRDPDPHAVGLAVCTIHPGFRCSTSLIHRKRGYRHDHTDPKDPPSREDGGPLHAGDWAAPSCDTHKLELYQKPE